MTSPDTYHRAKTLFLAASGLPRGERTRFLTAQCGGDEALEAHIRRLITAEEGDPEFLEAPPVASTPPLGVGDRLGTFRIVRLLGEGGMGVVYEAQQDVPSRRVALKLVRPGFFSARLRSRFRHEIRILGQLRHPGIAPIYEAGTMELAGEQVPYFAMELVEGRPLLESARERRLGAAERLALVGQVCDAVHHAHQKGVIHRDLKPGNILVEDAPTSDTSRDETFAAHLQVKVLDFGIARAIDAQPAETTLHTHAGQLIGTLPYMSPEQATGDPGAMDVRSDIYSIGVIAYELLAHRLPYELGGRPLAAAVAAIRDVEPPRLGSHDRSLRGDIETIVAKALQKDPLQRYQSAADFAADIRRFLRHEPIVARPASALYMLRKFARRHRPAVAAAALVLAAMAGATVVSTWQAGVAMRARTIAESEQRRADAAAAAASRQARRATLAASAAAIDSGDSITARKFLESTDERSRGWAWRYWHACLDQSTAMFSPGERIAGAWLDPAGAEVLLVTLSGAVLRGSPWADGGRLPRIATLDEAPVWTAAITEDGTRIAAIYGPDRRGLGLFDSSTGSLVRTLGGLDAWGGLVAVSASADAVFAGLRRVPRAAPADELWAWRAADAWRALRVRDSEGITGLAISGDGRWIASGFSTVRVSDARDLTQRELAENEVGWLRFAWSADASRLATGGEDRTVRIWDRDTGALLRSMGGHAGEITALAFDPAGHTLATAGSNVVKLWDVESGAPGPTLSGHERLIRSLQFAGSGGPLLSVAEDGTARLWRPDPLETVSILRGHSSYVYAVAFTPDGSRILSGAWDRSFRAWDAAGGRPIEARDAGEERGYITALAVSPDGAMFATGHKIGGWSRSVACLWDAETHELIREVGDGRGGVCKTLFSPDGTKLWVAWDHHGVDEFDLSASPPARRRLMVGEPRALAVTPDGRTLFVGQVNGRIARLDATTGEEIGSVAPGSDNHGDRSRITDLAMHPHLPLLASASADGTAQLWDLDAARCAATLLGHSDAVYAAAFSPDGEVLATGSDDTTIIIWDARSGEELTRLRGHEAYIYSLAFSPDGTRLVSGSGDATVRVWDTRPVRERWAARFRTAVTGPGGPPSARTAPPRNGSVTPRP